MKYYKVVSKEEGGLFSCLVPPYNGFRCEYEKGKWTKGISNSLLFVFSDKGSAFQFSFYFDFASQIWECEIDDAESIETILRHLDETDDFSIFWKQLEISSRNDGGEYVSPPQNTLVAKRVKLIKEVT